LLTTAETTPDIKLIALRGRS